VKTESQELLATLFTTVKMTTDVNPPSLSQWSQQVKPSQILPLIGLGFLLKVMIRIGLNWFNLNYINQITFYPLVLNFY
jgi:hypothetical protein